MSLLLKINTSPPQELDFWLFTLFAVTVTVQHEWDTDYMQFATVPVFLGA